MKKIIAVSIILFSLASSSLAAQAGKWQCSVNNMVTGNFLNDALIANPAYSGSVPCIGYNFTEEQSVDIGYFSQATGSQTATSGLIKYTYYFGHGNLQPHIGVSFGQVTTSTSDLVREYSALSLLFGTEINVYEGLYIGFDFRPLSNASRRTVKTDDPSEKDSDYVNGTLINIFPMISLKWVF
jgi:hypothetical protein